MNEDKYPSLKDFFHHEVYLRGCQSVTKLELLRNLEHFSLHPGLRVEEHLLGSQGN